MIKYRHWRKVVQAAMKSHSTRTFYDNISSIYDDVFTSHKVHANNITQVLTDTFPSKRQKVSVLDLGCGTGMLSTLLAENGFSIVGIDISFLSLCRLKQKTHAFDVIQADADFLPIQNRSLDAVVCLGSWRHFSDIGTVAGEIARLLKTEGIFIVGYFPPALAGVIHINQKWINQILHWLYGAFIRKLGYWDRTDCLFVKETEQILRTQFKNVLDLASDPGKHMLFAHYPTNQAKE
ncbi:MAG: class I SAM-dependent methyltransferase [Desulforhopalus sp.]